MPEWLGLILFLVFCFGVLTVLGDVFAVVLGTVFYMVDRWQNR